MNDLDRMLGLADPARELLGAELTRDIAEMGMDAGRTRKGSHRRWSRRRLTIPSILVGGLALCGAAVVVPSMILWSGENGELVDLDIRIPIEYETTSGVNVSCEYGLYVSGASGRSERDQQVADVLAAQDWAGIGQEVYDYAIAHPAGGESGIEADEPRQVMTFQLAMRDMVSERLPEDLRDAGWGSTDTCTGPYR